MQNESNSDKNKEKNTYNCKMFYNVESLNKLHSSLNCNQQTFNFAHLNVRSIVNKLDDLKNLLNSLKFEIDIFAITESWLDANKENQINISDYTYKGKHRINKHGGGVGFFN